MLRDANDVVLPLDKEWSIIQWRGLSGDVYYDILHCAVSVATAGERVSTECLCGQKIPENVRGFLVLCRNRNDITS